MTRRGYGVTHHLTRILNITAVPRNIYQPHVYFQRAAGEMTHLATQAWYANSFATGGKPPPRIVTQPFDGVLRTGSMDSDNAFASLDKHGRTFILASGTLHWLGGRRP